MNKQHEMISNKQNEKSDEKPLLVMSYDYDDWRHSPQKINELIAVFKEAGYDRIHWRVASESGMLYRSTKVRCATDRLNHLGGPDFDPLAYGIEYAHKLGMQVYSYIDCWENIGPLGDWGKAHPECCMMTRAGERWTGGISYAYPESRAFRAVPIAETAQIGVDGIYLENWSWHAGGAPTDWIGFEPPVASLYQQRYGINILSEPFALDKLKEIQGIFFRQFLVEARDFLSEKQKIAFSYPFSQRNCLHHLPVLDLQELVRAHVIDELILGIGFGDDYEAWLTHEGRQKATDLADFCHRHGRRFMAYIYTDQPYAATFGRYGAAAVRERFKNDVAWLAGAGVDGFTNRNVPESLTGHGAPAPGDSESVSDYLVPAGKQLWSGAAEGAQADAGVFQPPWLPPELPEQAPEAVIVIPRSHDGAHNPAPHQADYYPDSYKGQLWHYRLLFGLLGYRLRTVTTREEWISELSRRQHGLIVLAHDCCKDKWLSDWLENDGDEILAYVGAGGTLLTEAGASPTDQPILAKLKLSLAVEQAAGSCCFDRRSVSAYDAACLPAWVDSILIKNDETNGGQPQNGAGQPLLLAGAYKTGRILCSTLPFLDREYAGINPQDGPRVSSAMLIWQAIGRQLFPGQSLPLDRAMERQDEKNRLAQENLLANGRFDQGLICDYPAFWMIRSRNPAGIWRTAGDGVQVQSDDAGCRLRLDINKVKDLTSMAFPVEAGRTYCLSGMYRAEALADTPHTQFDLAQICYISFCYSCGDNNMINGSESATIHTDLSWRTFRIETNAIKAGGSAGPYKGWLIISLKGRHPCESERRQYIYLSNLKVKAI